MKTGTKILASAVAAATLVGFAAPASARLTDADAARLGADLTPMGAEKAGNKDGTIPAWTGGLCAPPSGWAAAKGYVDPFASDKPKFTISKANVNEHKDKLTPGTLALLNKFDKLQDARLRDASDGLLSAGRVRRGQGDGDESSSCRASASRAVAPACRSRSRRMAWRPSGTTSSATWAAA